ncbi:PAS domain S-box protein [uncultured Azohydromonas sp.]|uniref:PAS domain S-box protein n=1 Tax=uncultured Azohydromonas sp. TaxID=487342 RepID=UPI0026183390|nr:PAS domain S-box protein [uncultured Azohydromonas sp.]
MNAHTASLRHDPVRAPGRLADQLRSLHRIALAVAQPAGPTLFDDLVCELAAALGAAIAFVAVHADESRQSLRTLAARLDGQALANFDYRLEGSPCACVVDGFRYVAQGAGREFPPGTLFAAQGMDAYAAYPMHDSAGAPLGLLVTMDRRPVAGGDAGHAEAVLKIVASRLAAEIERSRTDALWRSAALAVSAASGDTVFDELVRLLATLLGVEIAFIARHLPEDPAALHMLALHQDGQLLHGIRYAVAGTPCETVLGQQFRAYASALQERFPDDEDARAQCQEGYAGYPLMALDGTALGIVSVASRRPLQQIERIESLLKIFALRAAAEIERLNAAEALRRSEASYRAIFDAAEDAIFVHDWDSGAILDVNAKACETYGWTREELRRLTVADISASEPPYTAQDAARWLQLGRLGRCPAFEWQRRNRDGSLHWDEVRIKPAVIDGRPHLLAFTRDITERLERERELQRSEARLRATVEAAFDCVVGMDGEGRIVEFNAAAERSFGHRRENVLGRTLAEVLLPEHHREAHARGLRHFHGSGRGPMLGRLVETTALHADGREIPVELAISVAAVPEGSIFVGHLRDISERRTAEAERMQLEAQLRQAQKMEAIGQLTGGIAHDFNNILTSVIGYLVLGQERAEAIGDATLVRQLGQAQLAAQRARDLIAQMLAFARRQRGERRVLALPPLVSQTLSLLRSTLPASVEIDAPAALADDQALAVSADPVQLEQVLFNLCINARDAMAGRGRITVRIAPQAGHGACASCKARIAGSRWLALSVADSGGGVAPDIAERIFDPFFSTKAPGQGSGMGLAMVHGIVHDHGGHLLLQSAPGQGATFTVLLPAAAAHTGTAGAPASTVAPTPPALAGRVLVVEDDAMVGGYLAEQLGGWGLEVVLQRDPLAALAWLRQPTHRPDLLITDLTMPQMTGLQLACEAVKLCPALPVLLISGQLGALDAEELERCGVRATLAKPLAARQLRALLRQWLPAPEQASSGGHR